MKYFIDGYRKVEIIFMKKLKLTLTFVVCLFGLSAHLEAQTYPNRPIKMVVPFPPGETADILVRLLGPKMSEKLGQTIVIVNHAGASGIIGMDEIAKASPDGYTIGIGQVGNLAILPHTKLNLPYNVLRDLTPIAVPGLNYLGIVTTPRAPFKNLGQMIVWAKEHPGQLTVGTNGEGGFPHLTFEYLSQTAKFQFAHIPYKGASQIIPDLIGGQIMVSISGVSSQASQISAGNLKLLAITNSTRVSTNPDYPTVAETFPGWSFSGWLVITGPARMDPVIVSRLNEAINSALRDPGLQEQLNQVGLIPVTEPPQFAVELIKTENAKFAKLVKDIGFKPQ
jgi:tripartite-type tricarboxylate transporter receptor subunit TctC